MEKVRIPGGIVWVASDNFRCMIFKMGMEGMIFQRCDSGIAHLKHGVSSKGVKKNLGFTEGNVAEFNRTSWPQEPGCLGS